MKKGILLLLTFWISLLFGEESIVISADPSSIFTNETFQLQVSFNNFDKEISLTSTKGLERFEMLGRPQQSNSSRWENINGKTTAVKSIILNYSLRAKETGTFNIGPFEVKSGGKKYKSNITKIKVYKSGDNIPKDKRKNRSFIRTIVSDLTPYPGETIRVDYYLYVTPDQNIRSPQLVESPKMKGFIKKDIKLSDNRGLQQKIYKGVKYNTLHIMSYYLTPTASGKYDLASLELDVPIEEKRKRRRGMDPFFDDDIFSSFRSNYKNRRVSSNSIKIDVKPFPEKDKPADFGGLSGDFSITTTIDNDSVNVNDAITVKFKLKGKGNFNAIESLDIKFPEDFEVYDPVKREKIKGNNSGYVELEYVLIPRFPGKYRVEPTDIHFFNPIKKGYQTIKTKELNIRVEGDANIQNSAIPSNITRKEIKIIGKDIRYIKSRSDLLTKDQLQLNSKILGSTILIFIPTLFYILAIKLGKSDKNLLRKAKAFKQFRKIYNRSKKELDRGDIKQFYGSIELAIFTYFADKLSKAASGIIPDEVYNYLLQAGIEQNFVDNLKMILDRCSMNKFISSSLEEAKKDFIDTPTLLEKIEEVI